MNKNLAFVIKTNQDYIRHTGKDADVNAPELNALFESISDIYIPLLNMIERLEKENIKFRFGLVLSPVLCNLLDSDDIKEQYIQWINKRILLGENQLQLAQKNNTDEKIVKIIQKTIENNKQLQNDFEEKFNRNLIKKFAEFHQKKYLELIATCGTDIFMPHYSDLPEIISAQIETGLQSYRSCFGEFPDGFWLPELGYTPGIEKIIRAYGYSYTILDSRSVLLCDKIPSKGIFYPSRTDNSLAVFAKSPDFDDCIFGEDGFENNVLYRNQKRDIGFELPLDQLTSFFSEKSPRYSTGYKYWNRCFDNEDNIYNEDAALEQIKKDADVFLSSKKDLFQKVEQSMSDSDFIVSVCTFDATKMNKNWGEWLSWFEAVCKNANSFDIEIASCCDMLGKQFTLERISPYYSAASGDGYGENLLSSKNCWMMRYIRKASERMIDLADRFPNDTGLKTRLLNIGAKELLIAQSSGLSKMIDEEEYADFAEKRFGDSIKAFTSVFESLGSNTVSTEWLTTLENKDNLFSWMNYRIFSKKK